MKLLSFFAGLWNFYGARARRRPYFVGDRRFREIVKFFLLGFGTFMEHLLADASSLGATGDFVKL